MKTALVNYFFVFTKAKLMSRNLAYVHQNKRRTRTRPEKKIPAKLWNHSGEKEKKKGTAFKFHLKNGCRNYIQQSYIDFVRYVSRWVMTQQHVRAFPAENVTVIGRYTLFATHKGLDNHLMITLEIQWLWIKGAYGCVVDLDSCVSMVGGTRQICRQLLHLTVQQFGE